MPLARIGPMVEPQSMSLRMLNSCVGMPRLWASSLQVDVITVMISNDSNSNSNNNNNSSMIMISKAV